ncbi:MAG: tRNA (adenosine(37)-N6)-dimethylallyltransferase MiaA [Candidatus Komeilibacteria bacterium]
MLTTKTKPKVKASTAVIKRPLALPKPKVIVILGPTASGKSLMAIHLAQELNGEIVSADSRHVYKYFNIGTNKITIEEQKVIPHYLIDIAEPTDQIYLPDYQAMAVAKIDDILKQQKVPFLVGGTGLYLSAVVENYQIPNVAPQPKLREELDKLTTDELIFRLKKVDPEGSQLIYQNNRLKLIRAIEFSEITGRGFVTSQATAEPKHDYCLIGIEVDRELLYSRINTRVHEMLKRGLEDEVKKLSAQYGWDCPAMLSIGYREWHDYFDKKITREQIISQIQQDTRNYAKRQMTWFWRMEKKTPITWVGNEAEAKSAALKFLDS